VVPLIPEIHELTLRRIAATDRNPNARLFTGPRGGRITTAVLRDATSWDEVVTKLGYEHLRRHDLRPDRSELDGRCRRAHPSPPQDRRARVAHHNAAVLHPNRDSVSDAAALLSKHLAISPDGLPLRAVPDA
jgi:hypothetical protein